MKWYGIALFTRSKRWNSVPSVIDFTIALKKSARSYRDRDRLDRLTLAGLCKDVFGDNIFWDTFENYKQLKRITGHLLVKLLITRSWINICLNEQYHVETSKANKTNILPDTFEKLQSSMATKLSKYIITTYKRVLFVLREKKTVWPGVSKELTIIEILLKHS